MKVLFLSPGIMGQHRGSGRLASFQEADVELLREMGHEVDVLLWQGRPLRALLRGTRWADVVFAWSISDHALAASFAARRLVCVIGGYEFAGLPECNYGNMLSFRMRVLTRAVWKKADALLYVDPSLMDEATAVFGHPGRAHYIPTGYDPGYWSPGTGRRMDRVLTVCHVPTQDKVRLKGVDLFVRAAEAMPDVEFHLVGEFPAAFEVAPNLNAHGWLERDDLRDLYRGAKVYAQLSLHEGLPNALCEAMLCGCVPVGTPANGIPLAIGDAGFVVERSVDSVVDGIRQALRREDLSVRARERIAKLFPVERRRMGLQAVLESVGPATVPDRMAAVPAA